MILLIVGILASCQTVQKTTEPLTIPSLANMRPTRPTLEKLPEDNTAEALRIQTINLSRLMSTIQLWERYDTAREGYYQTVIEIIQR